MDLLLMLAAVFAAGLVYFAPGLVAARNNHPQFGALMVVNVLLGWTLLGWVGALAWALLGGGKKRCPDCAEMVQEAARKCRFCGHSFR